jgi:hypothetical protein
MERAPSGASLGLGNLVCALPAWVRAGLPAWRAEDIIATASEDATMNVWQLPIGGNKVGCGR